MGSRTAKRRRGRWRVRLMRGLWALASLFTGIAVGSVWWAGQQDLYGESASVNVSLGCVTLHWVTDASTGRLAQPYSSSEFRFMAIEPEDRAFMVWPPSGLYTNAGAVRGPNLHSVRCPLWLPALGAALPAALLWRAGRRRPQGGCAHCGYSRAGLADGAACPECGAGASK